MAIIDINPTPTESRQPNSDRLKDLYEILKDNGAKVGTSGQFRDWMMASEDNRRQVYEVFKDNGAKVGEQFSDFDTWLYDMSGQPTYNTQTGQSGVRQQPTAQQPTQRKTRYDVAQEQYQQGVQQTNAMPISQTAMGSVGGYGISPTGIPVRNTQGYPMAHPQPQAPAKPMAPAPRAGQWSGAPIQQTPYAPTEEEGNLSFMPIEQGEDTKARYDAERRAVGGQGGQVQRQREEVDSMLAEGQGKRQRRYNPTTRMWEDADGNPTTAGTFEEMATSSVRERDLQAAQRALGNAQKMIDEANAGNKGFIASAGRGMRDKFFDPSMWDFGITDLTDQAAIYSALQAYDEGGEEALTESQRQLLDAKALELATTAYFGSEVGRGYKAGQVTAEAIPFMFEMAINPAAGIGKGASKAMVRYALKKFGKEAIEKGGKRYIAKQAMKYGTRIVGDVVGASGMAATTGAARTAADAMQRMAGNLHYGTDEQGNITFDGHTDAESWVKAFGKAFASTTIENYSEMLGNYFGPALGLLGKGAGKVGRGIARTKAGAAVGRGIDRIGGAIETAYNSTLSKKIGLQAVGDFISKVPAGKVAGFLSELEKRAQWHGVMGEYAEEVAGGILNALVVGDQTLDTDQDTGVFNWDNNVDTFLGVALLGGFLAGAKTVGYGREKAHNARQFRKANRMGASAFGDGWADVQAAIERDPKAGVKAVKADPNSTKEQREAALRYAQAVVARQGMEQGKAKRDAEGIQTHQERAAEQSYNTGYEDANTDELRSDINMAYTDARQKLVGLIGEDAVNEIDNDPLAMQAQYDQDMTVDDNTKSAIADYVSAKSAWDGVQQRISDDAADRADQRRAEGEKMAYKGKGNMQGAIRPLIINEESKEEVVNPQTGKKERKKKTVYLVNGNIAIEPNSNGLSREGTDKTIYVYDPETGDTHELDPFGGAGVLSVGDVVSMEDYLANNEQQSQAEVQQAAETAQGKVKVNTPFETPQGRKGVVQSIEGDNAIVLFADGEMEQASMPLAEVQQYADALRRQEYEARHPQETATEQPQQPNTATKGQTPTATTETPTEGGNATEDTRTPAQRTYDDVVAKLGADRASKKIDATAKVKADRLNKAQKALKTAQETADNTEYGSKEEQKAEEAVVKAQAEYDAAQQDMAAWDEVRKLRDQALLAQAEQEEQQRKAELERKRAAETEAQRKQREAYEAEQARRKAEAEAAEKRRQEENERLRQQEAEEAANPQPAEQPAPIEGTKGQASQLAIARQELADDPGALAMLEDMEPTSLEEVAAMLLTSGKGQVRLLREDFKRETGYSDADVKRYPFLFAGADKGGITLAQFGEKVIEEARDYNIPFDENDAMVGVNAVLNMLSSVGRQSDINDYVAMNRIRMAYDYHNAALAAARANMLEAYGMTEGEYEAYMSWLEDAIEQGKSTISDEEFNQLFNVYEQGQTTDVARGNQEGTATTERTESAETDVSKNGERGNGETDAGTGEQAAVSKYEEAESAFFGFLEWTNWEYGTNYDWNSLMSFLKWANKKAKAKNQPLRKFVSEWIGDKYPPKDAAELTDKIFAALKEREEAKAQQPKEEAEGGTETAPQPVGGATAQGETPAAEQTEGTAEGEKPTLTDKEQATLDKFNNLTKRASEIKAEVGQLIGEPTQENYNKATDEVKAKVDALLGEYRGLFSDLPKDDLLTLKQKVWAMLGSAQEQYRQNESKENGNLLNKWANLDTDINKALRDHYGDKNLYMGDMVVPFKGDQSGKGEKVKNEAAPKQKIDDVGEKIGGARKDLAQKMGAKINLDADTFPKMFPKFDLKKAVEQGLDPKLASAVYILRIEAQQSYKSRLKHYSKENALSAAKFWAAYAKQFLENGNTSTEFKDSRWTFTEYGKKHIEYNLALYEKVYEKFGNTLFDLDFSGYTIRPVEKNKWNHYYRRNEKGEEEEYQPAYEAVAGYSSKYYTEGELDKAIDELVDRMAESVSYKESHPYKLSHYYTPGVANSHYVGVKLGGKVVPLTDKMGDKETSKYLKEHEAELQEKAKRFDEERKHGKQGGTNTRWKPELGLGGGRARVGNDYRNGKDVSAEEFRETFGFRGVEFGNYVTQAERQRFLNEAYDAMMDLAALLNVSPRALSLGGRLGFAIGARGGGNAVAHYEPDMNVINLTKSKGAGSLAHEWWHALDYYFNSMGDYRRTPATANKRAEDFNPGHRAEMANAFVSLMEKINGSDYRKRSVALDAALNKDYYTNPTELGARAFQDYVQRRLTDKGQVNDFLSSFTPEEQWNGKAETYPYPTGKDADAIDERFDNLFGTMLEREDEQGNVMLYERADGKAEKVSVKERKLRDAVVDLLRKAGIEVVTESEEVQRVLDMANGRERQHRVYHGSGADFEAFDHSHMGEGEGAQAFGWGTYVTEVKGIGKSYAQKGARNQKVNNALIRGSLDFFWKGQPIDQTTVNPLQLAAGVVYDSRTIAEARNSVDKYIDYATAGGNAEMAEKWKETLDILKESKKSDFTNKPHKGNTVLYTVEIPEDNGSNYLDWSLTIPKRDRIRIAEAVRGLEGEPTQSVKYANYTGGWGQLAGMIERNQWAFQEVRDRLLEAFGGRIADDKKVSELMHDAGFVGIKYPADYYNGGRADNAKNYVIFNESDLQITDKVKFFRTENGEAYGFTMGGKIYLDPKIATAETPIHEYTHLWAAALRAANPKAWEQLKSELEKDKDLMAYVQRLYPELKGDELMDEVFAHFSGRRGAERLRAEQERMEGETRSIVGKAKVIAMFENLRNALKKFWNAARELFGGKSVKNESAEDFADMVLADLVSGFNPRASSDVRFRGEEGPVFYSNAMRAVENIKQERATPEQWVKMIEKQGGMKAGEDKWLGLSEWLKGSDAKTLTKGEVLDYIRANEIQVEEVEYAGKAHTYNETRSKFIEKAKEYIEENGINEFAENYGEEAAELFNPRFDYFGNEDWSDIEVTDEDALKEYLYNHYEISDEETSAPNPINSTRLQYTTEGLDNKREIVLTVPTIEPWNEQDEVHFGEAGGGRAVAWVRFGETTDADGKRVLVIDEIQSNRHQKGREKGYRKEDSEYDEAMKRKNALLPKYQNGTLTPEETEDYQRAWDIINSRIKSGRQNTVPDAPFDKNWHEVAMKRMLRYAAENGYDKVAWTKGEQQAERYDIGNAVSSIEKLKSKESESLSAVVLELKDRFGNEGGYMTYHINDDGIIRQTYDTLGTPMEGDFVGKPLSDVIGKELAQKIIKSPVGTTIDGEGLRIGGEGMKGFYDQILPRFMDKYGKKWGVKTGEVELPNIGDNGLTMWSVDITDDMRESVMRGQPLFRKSTELFEQYPTWLSGQTTSTGQHTTQITSTVKTYQRIGDWMQSQGMEGAKVLDASSGLGAGTQALRDMGFDVEDVEPYPSENREAPTYTRYEDVNGKYDVVISNAVLNVIPDDWRADVLRSMADKVKEGGKLIINVRDAKSIESQKQKIELDSPSEILVTDSKGNIRAYQKGFTKSELKAYVESELGEGWQVEIANEGNSGVKSGTAVVVTRGEGAEVTNYRNPADMMREGGEEAYAGEWYDRNIVERIGEFAGYTPKQIAKMNARQEESARKQFNETAEKLHLSDNITFADTIDDVPGLTDEQRREWRRKKGWYSPRTGKIVIILGNHKNMDDVMKSILHEGVAHHGLRQLFGEHFNTFLDNVYRAASPEIRDRINTMAKKHGWDFREATEEYLATLSEDTEFEKPENQSWWKQVKAWFIDLLHKIGFKLHDAYDTITDNELRYILWRSYQNLVNPGRYNSVVEEAKDIAKQYDLKVGEWDESRSVEDMGPNATMEFNGRRIPIWATNGRRGNRADRMERNDRMGSDYNVAAEGVAEDAAEYAQRDAEYMEAVNNGDMEKAQRMVNEAAKRAMPNSKYIQDGTFYPMWHFTDKEFTSFLPGTSKDPNGIRGIYFAPSNKGNISSRFGTGKPYFLNVTNPIVPAAKGRGEELADRLIKMQEGVTDRNKIAEINKRFVEETGVDGVIDALNGWCTMLDPSQIKSAEPVTYDDNGNVIPLSQRFNEASDDIRFRDGEDEETDSEERESIEQLANDRSIGTAARFAAVAARNAQESHDNAEALAAALNFTSQNLAEIVKATKAQKKFDKATVKQVTDMARVMVSAGYLDSMGRADVKGLLKAIRESTGETDNTDNVNRIIDIMVKNQLKTQENTLATLLKIKGSRVDARGINVQGKLDPNGQQTIKAFKDNMKEQRETIESRIADAEERMTSEDRAIADAAYNEKVGLQLALDYVEKIGQSKADEKDIEAKKRAELSKVYDYTRVVDVDEQGNALFKKDGTERTHEVRHVRAEYKGKISDEKKAERERVEQTAAAMDDAIRHMRMERIDAYTDFIAQVAGNMKESMRKLEERREAEKRRIEEIHHNANSDMEGRPASEHRSDTGGVLNWINNTAGGTLFAPLASFGEMLRMFGRKSPNGEGYLFNRFMRGLIDARHKELNGVHDKYSELDKKAHSVFGGKVETWADMMNEVRKGENIAVEWFDGKEKVPHTLHQGNLMYIYMVNKMSDGRMKLRHMGIDEKAMAVIESKLDPRLKEIADWLQEDFLVRSRNEYNETHKRMFGASMSAIEDYFPLVINSGSRNKDAEKEDAAENNSNTITTATGAIKKRTVNVVDLDLLNADAMHVILDHIAEMEHWNAFAEYNRDLNTLRSYKRFENQVKNMTTILGDGEQTWKAFNKTAQIAVGSYQKAQSDLDAKSLEFASKVTAAKVAFRINTALKQLLSLPAYLPYANASGFYHALANDLGNGTAPWKWCMENLPMYRERWESRVSGDPRLLKLTNDWKSQRATRLQKISRAGMLPNAAVDALTVSIGAHAVYETRKAQYLKEGYSEAAAEKRAIQDAEIAYNETQQSSEGGFVSVMQVDKSWLNVLFTIFRNASMAYQRQLHGALRNLINMRTKARREQAKEFLAKQIARDGVNEAQARLAAEQRFNRAMRKNWIAVATFGYIVQFAWNFGGQMWYLLFGDDDDKKKKTWKDILIHSLFGGVEGLTGGDWLSELGRQIATGDRNPQSLNKDMPLTSDMFNIIEKFGQGREWEAVSDIINLAVQAGVGANPQTLTDAVAAAIDACNGDLGLAKEASLFAMRVIQVPQSQTEQIYFDEIGMTGEEARKLSYEQLVERYAKYRVKRNFFWTPWEWDNEKALEKGEKRGERIIKERMETMSDEQLEEALSNLFESSGEKGKKLSFNQYAKREGLKGYDYSDVTKNDGAKYYMNIATWRDIAEDITLHQETKRLGDEIKRLKELGVRENEAVYWQTDDKLKDLNKVKKEIGEMKKEMVDANGNPMSEEIINSRMENIRTARRRALYPEQAANPTDNVEE